jgi:hypothetical protein
MTTARQRRSSAAVMTVVLAQAVANDPDIGGCLCSTRLNPRRSVIASPHAATKDVFVDDAGGATDRAGDFPFAEGAVLVKESTDADTLTVEAITVMRKVAGFDPDNGDWQYAMFERQEDGTMDGMWFDTDHEMHAMCVGCHVGAAETDFAFLNYMGD